MKIHRCSRWIFRSGHHLVVTVSYSRPKKNLGNPVKACCAGMVGVCSTTEEQTVLTKGKTVCSVSADECLVAIVGSV